MFDAWLRALKDRVFARPARWLGRWVHPNGVTAAAFLAGLVAAILLARGRFGWGLAFWVLNRLLDGLDGTVARESGQQSDFGGYLDILLDFGVYALLPIGLAAGAPSAGADRWLALLLGSFFVNAASWMYLAAVLEKRAQGAVARGERTTVTMPPGLVAGTETVIFYSLFMIFPEHLAVLFGAMALGVLLTIAQRLAWAARHL